MLPCLKKKNRKGRDGRAGSRHIKAPPPSGKIIVRPIKSEGGKGRAFFSAPGKRKGKGSLIVG